MRTIVGPSVPDASHLFDPIPDIVREWRFPSRTPHRRPTRKRRIAEAMELATYSVFAIGTGVSTGSSNTLTPNLPAGTLTGKLMLLWATCSNASLTITTPANWTLLSTGSVTSSALFGRIGTASESAPNVVWSSSSHAKTAQITAFTSSTGWPAIGSVLIDVATGNHSSTSGKQRYGALTVTQGGLMAVQFASRNTNTGDVSPATAVAVTSGYTNAGQTFRNAASSGLASSMQLMDASPGVGATVAQNDETITGNSDNLAQRWITATFKGVADSGYSLDAFPVSVSQPNAFPPSFQATYPLDSGDTYEIDPDVPFDPPGGECEAADGGALFPTFDSDNPVAFYVPFRGHIASAPDDDIVRWRVRVFPVDGSAPEVTSASVIDVTDTTCAVVATLTDDRPPMTWYVVVVLATADTPSASQIIVGTDVDDVTAPNASHTLDANGTASAPITGLSPETDYKACAVARDAEGNVSSVVELAFTTAGAEWPDNTVAPHTTEVEPAKLVIEVSRMGDGKERFGDYSVEEQYAITIHYPAANSTERTAVDEFIEENIRALVDVPAVDGFSYRCLLKTRMKWTPISRGNGVYSMGTITLIGTRIVAEE